MTRFLTLATRCIGPLCFLALLLICFAPPARQTTAFWTFAEIASLWWLLMSVPVLLLICSLQSYLTKKAKYR